MSWIVSNYGLVASVLLGILEAVSLLPGIGASGYIKFFIFIFRRLATTDPEQVGPSPDSAKVAEINKNPKV